MVGDRNRYTGSKGSQPKPSSSTAAATTMRDAVPGVSWRGPSINSSNIPVSRHSRGNPGPVWQEETSRGPRVSTVAHKYPQDRDTRPREVDTAKVLGDLATRTRGQTERWMKQGLEHLAQVETELRARDEAAECCARIKKELEELSAGQRIRGRQPLLFPDYRDARDALRDTLASCEKTQAYHDALATASHSPALFCLTMSRMTRQRPGHRWPAKSTIQVPDGGQLHTLKASIRERDPRMRDKYSAVWDTIPKSTVDNLEVLLKEQWGSIQTAFQRYATCLPPGTAKEKPSAMTFARHFDVIANQPSLWTAQKSPSSGVAPSRRDHGSRS